MLKKSALIIFPDEWLAYSPTVLNLIQCLNLNYEIKVITFDCDAFKNTDKIKDINFIKFPNLILKLLTRCRLFKITKLLIIAFSIIKLKTKGVKFDLIIAVDSLGYLAAKLFFERPVFLSLELNNDIYFKLSKLLGITHLIIQSEPRKKFLFSEIGNLKVSYIQNSPILDRQPDIARIIKNRKKQIAYLGNFIKSRGVEYCIESLYKLPPEFSLTLKGTIKTDYKNQLLNKYSDLTAAARLVIDDGYCSQSDIIKYLTEFYIGLCIYDLDIIPADDFNYLSCPSGKLFNYYAAGVPAVATDIIGLSSVSEYKTGVLIDELSPASIAGAILKIHYDYGFYANNCINASQKFDFKKAFDNFIQDLKN